MMDPPLVVAGNRSCHTNGCQDLRLHDAHTFERPLEGAQGRFRPRWRARGRFCPRPRSLWGLESGKNPR